MNTSISSASCAVLVLALASILAPAMLALIVSTARAADISSCAAITDADARAVCRAKALRDPGMCYSVQRPDLRTQCLAEVRK